MTGKVAARILDRLLASGWTNEELSAALCVSPWAFQKWRYQESASPTASRAKALRTLKPKAKKGAAR